MTSKFEVDMADRHPAPATTGIAEGPARNGDLSIELRGIEAVPESGRYGSPIRLATLWFGAQMCASMFMVGSLGPAFGVGFWPSFWIIIAANAMGVAPMAYLSTWGPRTGLAQMELAAAAFGRWVRLPALTNWLTTMGWQGLHNVFGICRDPSSLRSPALGRRRGMFSGRIDSSASGV